MTGDDRATLLDTGPLVAFLNRADKDHERCRETLAALRGALLSTEAVLTEATHLLSRVPGGPEAALTFFERGAAVLVPPSRPGLRRCRELITRYANVPMDYADASLVALAEEVGTRRIFTLDHRGFGTYRFGRRRSFRLLPD